MNTLYKKWYLKILEVRILIHLIFQLARMSDYWHRNKETEIFKFKNWPANNSNPLHHDLWVRIPIGGLNFITSDLNFLCSCPFELSEIPQHPHIMLWIHELKNCISSQGRIQDLAMGEGGQISSEASYIYERSELLAKGVTSEASINQLVAPPPRFFFEFRTPESESERNLTNYFIIFLLLFY